jgi:hypothetical protein
VAVGGQNVFRNQSFASDNSVASVGGTLTALITLKNRITLGNKFNLGKIAVIEVSVENDHTKSSTVEVLVNAALGGTTNFELIDDVNSIALIDKAGTTVTGGRFVGGFQVAAGGEKTENLAKFFIELLPEDTLTVAAKANTGTASAVTCSIAWIEEK